MEGGPQNPASILSAICECFLCTPAQALQENWQDIKGVMEYRALREANQYRDDIDKLSPEQIVILKEMEEVNLG